MGIRKESQSSIDIWKIEEGDNAMMSGIGNVYEIDVVRQYNDLMRNIRMYRQKISDYLSDILLPKITRDLKSALSRHHGFRSCYVFAYRNQLFKIESNGEIKDIQSYVVLGDHACKAEASLYKTIGFPPELRIQKAFESIDASTPYGYTKHIASTMTQSIEETL